MIASNYFSVQSIAEGLDTALIVAMVGAPDTYLESHRLQRLTPGSGHAAERLLQGGSKFLMWRKDAPLAAMPVDWQQLAGSSSKCSRYDACMRARSRHHPTCATSRLLDDPLIPSSRSRHHPTCAASPA